MLADYGLTWPWESLHVEALAWFDHWLKGHDTGIVDGAPIRYVLPGADEWRTAEHGRPRADASRTRAARRRHARRRRGRAGRPRVHGARRGPEPRQAQPDRPAVDADLDQRAARRGRWTWSATSSSARRRRRPPRTPPGSPRCRTSLPTATVTDVTGGLAARQPARGRRGGQLARRPRAALPTGPRPCRSARTSTTGSRWCPMPGASPPATGSGS